MLELKNISIEIDKKKIINNVSISFENGKTHFLLGKNGSGKSSLALTIGGHPKYKITSGEIFCDGVNITNLSPEERSLNGIFLSFQNVPEISGVNLGEYLRTIYNYSQKKIDKNKRDITPFLFNKIIKPILDDINIDDSFLQRDLNVGFSGGERRKIELIQIKLLNPKYIILDEIDSGLDIDAFKTVSRSISNLKNKETTLIFITHNFNIMEYLEVDDVFVLDKGKLIDKGDKKLIEKIMKHGYCDYCNINSENCDISNKCA